MAIYLMRHTKPDLAKGICCGQTDIDVASTFEEEFALLLPNLSSLNIERIYTSPLRRSSKLALRISEELNVSVKADPRLRELNYGLWEMQGWDKLPPTELNMWMIDFVNRKTPHGESYMQMYQRVNEFLNTNDLRNSLIVSHSGVMRCILCSLTNTPLNDSYKKFDFGYYDIFEMDMMKRSFKVLEKQFTYKS